MAISGVNGANGLSALEAVQNVLKTGSASGTAGVDATAFADFLSQAISDANETTLNSSAYTDALLSGEVTNLHDVTISSSETTLAISLVVQIRDRLVEAYNEIMRMQV